MNTERPGPSAPSVEELDKLSTDELRERAFVRAESRHDVGFFWDLLRHLPPTEGIAWEDGSAGHIGGSISELIEVIRDIGGHHDLGPFEPLLRARYIDYLRHGD